MSNRFNFFIESGVQCDISKAASKKEDRYNNMIVFGRATSPEVDRQGESLQPNGFDFSDFLAGGVIDLEHFYTRKSDPSAIIGQPIDAYVKNNEFYIKGKLYKGNKKAEALWDLMLNLKENNSDRKVGWSVEGKKQKSDPNNKKKITKAKISRAALTIAPVGFNTYADIAKGQQAADYIEPAYNDKEVFGQTYILQFEKDGKIVTINKDWSYSIKPKAMTTESLSPLTKESLKKKPFDITNWDNIMKGIELGLISTKQIPYIMKKIRNSLKLT